MPDNFQFNRNPRLRRSLGYLSRFYRDAVSGGDTGYTVFKGGLIYKLGILGTITLGTAALGAYAIPILIAAGIGIGIYIIDGMFTERDRNKAETQKIKEYDALTLRQNCITEEVNKTLNTTRALKNFSEMEGVLPDIKLTDDNDILLQYLLRTYLNRIGLQKGKMAAHWHQIANARRKTNGHLPSHHSLLRLLEQVSGLNHQDPQFPAKLNTYLSQRNYDQDLKRRIFIAFNINGGSIPPQLASVGEQPTKSLFWKAWTAVKMGIFLVARSNTAFGLIAGGALLLGLLASGVVSWPIIIGGTVVALLSGVASVVYKHYVEQDYKKNTGTLDKAINYNKTRYELLYKLNRQQQRFAQREQYSELNAYTPSAQRPRAFTDARYAHLNEVTPRTSVDYVPMSVRVRIGTQIIAQSLYGASAGVVIGIASISLILLLAGLGTPASVLLAFNLPNLIAMVGGTLLGARYAYILGNATYKAGQAEMKQIQKIATRQVKLEEDLGRDVVQAAMNSSNQELVLKLIQTYISYSQKEKESSSSALGRISRRSTNGDGLGCKALLEKKEKILQAIEQATGINRAIDFNTGLPSQEAPLFYQKLSLYLQENSNTAAGANNVVSLFKASVLNKPRENCQVSAVPPNRMEQAWTWIKANFSSGSKKHILPVLVTLAVAIPFGFMLFGQGALLLAAIGVAAVVANVIIHKVCESQGTANKEKLRDMELKLPLIRIVSKLQEKLSISPQPQHEADRDRPSVRYSAQPVFTRRPPERRSLTLTQGNQDSFNDQRRSDGFEPG